MIDTGVGDWIEKDPSSEIADKMWPDADIKNWMRNQVAARETYSADEKRDVERVNSISADVLLSMRLTYAAHVLRNLVEIDQDRMDGVPVLVGTRFTVARIIAEIADGMSVAKLAREFDLNKKHIVELLHGIAIKLDRPFV